MYSHPHEVCLRALLLQDWVTRDHLPSCGFSPPKEHVGHHQFQETQTASVVGIDHMSSRILPWVELPSLKFVCGSPNPQYHRM